MLLIQSIIFFHLQRTKEDLLSSSVKSRSKAHNLVRKMLASLRDPYTRFLSPEEVILFKFAYISKNSLVLLKI